MSGNAVPFFKSVLRWRRANDYAASRAG
jgi:hypothetical protein